MKIISVLLLFGLPLLAPGQTLDNSAAIITDTSTTDTVQPFSQQEINGYLSKRKINAGISAGVIFSTGFQNSALFGTFVAPELFYPLNNKLTIHTGLVIVNFSGNGLGYPYTENHINHQPENFAQSLIYLGSAYSLNDKLTISGTVYREFSVLNSESYFSDSDSRDYNGLIMGVDYKIGKNAVISGQIDLSNSPYRRYVQMNSVSGAGFGNSSIFP